MRRPPPAVTAVIVTVQVASAVLAWRDLKRRSDAQIRGPKKVWRIAIAVQPGNSLAYWAIGRRR